MKPCKLCGTRTNNGFNINFKLTPVCESCATAITMQQVKWWSQQVLPSKKEEPEEEPCQSEIDISDDLRANFRSWEHDCNDLESALQLAATLHSRHPDVELLECERLAKEWVGYDSDC